VSLKDIKTAARQLPSGHPVRTIIQSQPDSLPMDAYYAKASDWAILLKRYKRKKV